MQCPKCERGGTGPHPAFCTPLMRFWHKVRTGTGCWEWQGANNGRYGMLRLGKGHAEYAHRWIYEQLHGEIAEGLVVMHSCDNTRCVRPDHLRVGTQKENLQDAADKGRFTKWRKSA